MDFTEDEYREAIDWLVDFAAVAFEHGYISYAGDEYGSTVEAAELPGPIRARYMAADRARAVDAAQFARVEPRLRAYLAVRPRITRLGGVLDPPVSEIAENLGIPVDLVEWALERGVRAGLMSKAVWGGARPTVFERHDIQSVELHLA